MVKNKIKKEFHCSTILGIIFIFLSILYSFYIFYSNNLNIISEKNLSYLEDFTVQRTSLIKDIFDENIKYIESASIIFETELLDYIITVN